MGYTESGKPSSRPPGGSPPAASRAVNSKPTSTTTDAPPSGAAGRIIHDERGNAVWDWVKDTARIAIDSTSRLLMKLEVPELTVEDTQEHELSKESERDSGGGYDPFGGAGPTAVARRASGAPKPGNSDKASRAARGGVSKNLGGGY